MSQPRKPQPTTKRTDLPPLKPVTSRRPARTAASRKPVRPATPVPETSTSPQDTPRTFKQRLRRAWSRTWKIGLVLMLIALVVGYWQVHALAQAMVQADARTNPPLGLMLPSAVNVLVMGVDERPDHPEEGVRSDSLMLARIDPAGRWINLLSIPRDSLVNLPDLGSTKINAAYGYGYANAEALYGTHTTPQQGGMAQAAAAVEQLLLLHERGMRVDYTVQVNFDGFAGLIDAMGGVWIDVPYALIDEAYPTPDLQTMRVEFQPGLQHMDGATALIYARTRHADSDFSRSARQQQVLRAMVANMQQRNWFERTALFSALLDQMQSASSDQVPIITTMPINRPDVLLGGLLLASGLNPHQIGQLALNPDHVWVTEIGSDLIWDETGIRNQMDLLLQAPEG
ncbi:MAG: LCP family protein [Chloroflexaceae bacterium]|nr:LCP family protein [Chloroflexaceae bacterium]